MAFGSVISPARGGRVAHLAKTEQGRTETETETDAELVPAVLPSLPVAPIAAPGDEWDRGMAALLAEQQPPGAAGGRGTGRPRPAPG